MTASLSLRLRLLLMILAPLLLIALALGVWRIGAARETAEELFDRALLSAALAVSRDVAISGGDALLPSTNDLVADASGGRVYYHVAGPRGAYVTGYAYPPRLPNAPPSTAPRYAFATYRGVPVRVVQITEQQTVGGISGATRVTVWQDIAERRRFERALLLRSLLLMGGLLASLAAIIWFGVHRGLRPLLELEHAISLRSPTDLTPVRRQVPAEASGIVRSFNRLLGELRRSMDAHNAFISDASHQLRNPATAVLSLAEAARDAPDDAERARRLEKVVGAARQAVHTAEQLLSLDRLLQSHLPLQTQGIDLREAASGVCEEMAVAAVTGGLDFELDNSDAPVMAEADPVLISEALKNLIENAVRHGGPSLTRIVVSTRKTGAVCRIDVMDDGVGIPPDCRARVLERFAQIEPSSGSGLGLAIVNAVATRHGGRVDFVQESAGHRVCLVLPSRQ